MQEENLIDVSEDYVWSAAVASFGMILSQSEFQGSSTMDSVLELALLAAGEDKYRREFLDLVRMARQFQGHSDL